MCKYKILVTATNFSMLCKEAKAFLISEGCEIIENPFGRPMTYEERKDLMGDIDAVITGPDVWDQRLFEISPKLKCIARFGVGVDNIDLDGARTRGIKVFNAAGQNSDSVSEHTMALILACVREIPHLNIITRRDTWERCIFHELRDLTVGLLGFGGIARLVAEKLRPFHPRIIAYDKYPNYEIAEKLGVQMCSFEEVMSKSDVISLHLPSLPDTVHIINDESLSLVKKGAILINTARGTVVDEGALYRALTNGTLSWAGLDVYEKEPVSPENPLMKLSNVICTPHAAAESYEVYRDVAIFCAHGVISVLNGNDPVNWLNKA